MEEDIIKEWNERFSNVIGLYQVDSIRIEEFILSAVSQAKEEGRKQGVEEGIQAFKLSDKYDIAKYKAELREKIDKEFYRCEECEHINELKDEVINLIK